MADMADYALSQVEVMEDLRYRFHNEDMSTEEAVDVGFLEGNGMSPSAGDPDDYCEGPMTSEAVDRSIEHLALQLDAAQLSERKRMMEAIYERTQDSTTRELIDRYRAEAEARLERAKSKRKRAPDERTSRIVPKCEDCDADMAKRLGRYGEFYYCGSSDCGTTKTISVANWNDAVSAGRRELPSPKAIQQHRLPDGVEYGIVAYFTPIPTQAYITKGMIVVHHNNEVLGVYASPEAVSGALLDCDGYIDTSTVKDLECLLQEAMG